MSEVIVRPKLSWGCLLDTYRLSTKSVVKFAGYFPSSLCGFISDQDRVDQGEGGGGGGGCIWKGWECSSEILN